MKSQNKKNSYLYHSEIIGKFIVLSKNHKVLVATTFFFVDMEEKNRSTNIRFHRENNDPPHLLK